jgi:hypothetical protein
MKTDKSNMDSQRTGGYCATCLHGDKDCTCGSNLDYLKDVKSKPFSEYLADKGKTFVYIVESNSGSFDSHHSFITGVFDNEEDANELAERLDQKAADLYNLYKYDDDEGEDRYLEEYSKNPTIMEWNGSKVLKTEMNVNLYDKL